MTTKQKSNEYQRILTPEFRVSFPHVFKPSAPQPGAQEKYSITMLFSKTADLKVIQNAILQAKITAFGKDKSKWPANIQTPVSDGDNPKHASKQGYQKCWAIRAVSNQKPGLVDAQVQPIIDQATFYPGCHARAYVFARVWEFAGKIGVHFILDHIQKTRDDEPFTSRKAASEVFSPIESSNDEMTTSLDS